jgi:probable rRNA maturation factor
MMALMEQAADAALSGEFGDELLAAGFAVKDIVPELSVTVVGDEEIRELNRDYRGNDKVTDVLSFPQFEGHDELLDDLIYSAEETDNTTLVGDVVICFDQASRQAEEYGTGMTREMLYLFVHSVMHLFGYDHMEEGEKKIMREREEKVLSELGITR